MDCFSKEMTFIPPIGVGLRVKSWICPLGTAIAFMMAIIGLSIPERLTAFRHTRDEIQEQMQHFHSHLTL